MGATESKSSTQDYRMRNVPVKLPMPDHRELDERFIRVLKSMNLPPDKATALKKYDDEKKWELICDQERVLAKNPPQVYIQALLGYLDPSLGKKRFKKRIENSTKTLKELEISLRTNQIEWVWEFLSEENRGLDVLVDYLAFAQYAVVYESFPEHGTLRSSTLGRKALSAGEINNMGSSPTHTLNSSTLSKSTLRRQTMPNRRTLKNSRTIAERDDVHVCITCLRAIMNYKHGFSLVMKHPQCINEIALSLNNKSLRTKSLVLELLAAVCLVRGGHEIILQAFDNFKIVCSEPRRFTHLMQYFKVETENIDFMVSCMQFINIVVHSVEDLNYRVHLQHEFTLLGLDDYIMAMKDTESEVFKRQLQAYMDNMFNIRNLLEDSEVKVTALERVEQLEDQLLNLNEKFQEQEYENMTKIVELEKQLSESTKAIQTIKGTNSGVYALPGVHIGEKSAVAAAEMKGLPGLSGLPKLPPIKGLPGSAPPDNEVAGMKIKTKDSIGDGLKSSSGAPSPPPPPPMLSGGVVPPPPPPPGVPGAPPPPPAPGIPNLPGNVGLNALPGGLKIKKKHQTKYRLPVLNWKAMRPEQVEGTVFNELDDEAVLNEVDLNAFEELFKTRAQDSEADRQRLQKIAEVQQKRGTSLIDNNRARNIAITLRKIGLSTDQICRAVYSYDLEALPLEYVEMLPRFIPNELELRAFKQYEKDGHPFDKLAAEDKFMWLFGRVERLQQRLNIMIFIGNFNDNILTLTPQLASVIAASMSIKSSLKLKKVFEIILAFGNYMNSGKRGAVYGFKLQSLDALLDTKSTDKKQSLLHYIVSVIEAYYGDVKNFYQEIRYLDKASKVSLENVQADVRTIKNGLDLAQREYETHEHVVLKTFLEENTEKVQKLMQDAETAQEAYKEVIEYFGETPRVMPPEIFFPMVQRFIKSYIKAQDDLDAWRKKESKQKTISKAKKEKGEKKRNTKQQEEHARDEEERMINELRSRNKKLERGAIESKDGAIEDNIQYLKSEPYRRADTHQRSFRKKHRVGKAKVSTML